ncbi:hypothetical protein HGRIS_004759 [Hohenbuehelia grisea]|uniref:MYND-type domain-containing protein n=1 Tax=Hohenbuehelia grisea TaxID=104357 RepID=A0ABR3JDJ2_9AGAR
MRTGILEGIYLITNWPAAMRFNVDLLAGDLIPYLRYLSVLRPAEKSIRRLEKGYNEEFGLPMDNTGVLRAVIRANTSAAKLAACWKNRCDFLGCYHTGKRKLVLRRCDGCEKVFYCSKTCQSLDWHEGGHRSSCKTMRRARKNGWPIELSRNDIHFLSRIVAASMSVYLGDIGRAMEVSVTSDKLIHLHFDFSQPKNASSLDIVYESPSIDPREEWINVCARFARGRSPVWMAFRVFPHGVKISSLSKKQIVALFLGEMKKGFSLEFIGYKADEAHA